MWTGLTARRRRVGGEAGVGAVAAPAASLITARDAAADAVPPFTTLAVTGEAEAAGLNLSLCSWTNELCKRTHTRPRLATLSHTRRCTASAHTPTGQFRRSAVVPTLLGVRSVGRTLVEGRPNAQFCFAAPPTTRRALHTPHVKADANWPAECARTSRYGISGCVCIFAVSHGAVASSCSCQHVSGGLAETMISVGMACSAIGGCCASGRLNVWHHAQSRRGCGGSMVVVHHKRDLPHTRGHRVDVSLRSEPACGGHGTHHSQQQA